MVQAMAVSSRLSNGLLHEEFLEDFTWREQPEDGAGRSLSLSAMASR